MSPCQEWLHTARGDALNVEGQARPLLWTGLCGKVKGFLLAGAGVGPRTACYLGLQPRGAGKVTSSRQEEHSPVPPGMGVGDQGGRSGEVTPEIFPLLSLRSLPLPQECKWLCPCGAPSFTGACCPENGSDRKLRAPWAPGPSRAASQLCTQLLQHPVASFSLFTSETGRRCLGVRSGSTERSLTGPTDCGTDLGNTRRSSLVGLDFNFPGDLGPDIYSSRAPVSSFKPRVVFWA